MTLHEHLGVYLDWLTGVGYALDTGLADPKGLRAQLGHKLIWYAWFVEGFLAEIDRQTSDNKVPAPGWIELVRLAQKEIVGDVPDDPPQATLHPAQSARGRYSRSRIAIPLRRFGI